MQGQRTVAILGASTEPEKFSHKAVRAYKAQGWDVYPVHPTADVIGGLPVFGSLAEVPVKLDRVTLYLPPERGLTVLEAIAAAAPAEFYVNPGAESAELLARARELGLEPIQACSIVAVGRRPEEF